MKVSKATLLVLVAVGIFVSLYLAKRVHSELREKENALLSLYAERVQTSIESYAQIAKTFKIIIENQESALSDEDFEKLASVMYSPDVNQTIAFLPDGIVSQVFPKKDYHYTVGFNVFEDERTRADSVLAKELGELVVSGPFELVNGGFGFVIRSPIFVKNEFIGFTAVSMDLELFLDRVGITSLDEFGYKYKLTTMYNGGEKIAYESNNFDKSKAVSNNIQIENNSNTFTFELYIGNRDAQIFIQVSFWFFIIFFISLIIYFLLARFEQNKVDLLKKLEKDPLTGAFNRTKLYSFAESEHCENFALLFIDLNNFKPVNDTYGHEIGDKLLVAYVQRLHSHMPSNAIVLRLGGDEFIVIVPNIIEENLQSIANRVKSFSEEAFSLNGNSIYISASVGYVLSSEADSIDELVEIADRKMYYEKQKGKITEEFSLVSH